MRYEFSKKIKKELKKYRIKPINISGKEYSLYIIPELCDEDLNVFEGFLFVETESKSDVSYLKSKYKPPLSGYAPRLGLILYDGHLLIKDYRRNKHIIKTLRKINKTFLNKLIKALSDPKKENFNKLFDRTDLIEEFYILYKKTREFMLKNIKGIPEEEKREEFVDNFMMQMLTLWYLQERGFFNNDKNYFITKFKELNQKKLLNDFRSYYEFLIYLFEKISGYEERQYVEDPKIGKIVVIGPAVFLNGEHSKAVSIPDKCFYKEGMTDILINTPPEKVSQEVPLLNLFESRDWTEGNIDEFVLGAIYEKLITYMERKKLGAYYTPEEITSYICKNTIEPYFIDRINEKFKKNFETIDQIIESNDKDILLYLFEQLKEIKILDPAVGSAHFLESAINVLVEIYEKVKERAKELGLKKGFKIIASNEKGEIEEIDLIGLDDDEKFRLLIKFFIILSKNIYGVDINPSALKVARARLFLTLAKHFRVGKEKDIFIRFPNVHFNLREGNSLIGYVEIGKEKTEKYLQFSMFIKEEQSEYVTEKIEVVSELKPYLENLAKSLNIDRNIAKELEELNKILSKKFIDWDDFEKVLWTKEKLIRILIASLNSKYAKPLHKILSSITTLFNQKLDGKFAEEFKIKLDDLRKIKTFHWFFEFPEVFLKRGGFDVIIGNPPYGNTLSEPEKRLCESYASYTGEIASVFLERCIPMNRKEGYFSFIITFAITFSKYLSNTRKMIYENYNECKISTFDRDRCRFFDNMTQSVSIMVCKRKSQKGNCKFYTSKMFREMPDINSIEYQLANDLLLGDKIGVSFHEEHRLPKIGEKTILDILTKLIRNKQTLKSIISSNGERIWIRTSGNYWYNAWDKKPYRSTEIKQVMVSKTFKSFLIILMNSSIYYMWFRVYGDGRHMNTDIMEAFPFPTNEKIIAVEPLLTHLSDLLMKFMFYNFDKEHNRFNTSNVKPVIDICDVVMGKLYGFSKTEIDFILGFEDVIRGGKKVSDVFFTLIEYFMFDSYLQKEVCSNYEIIDSLVYELYFKEKFAEDGLYPEPKEYLLSEVSKHLNPINYDCWTELYWKKQLEGNLTKEEEKKFKELGMKNLKTVEDVYKSLKNDENVQKWIERIKSHKWVKIIEREK